MGKHKKMPPEHRSMIQKWIQDYQFKIVPDPDKDYIGPWGLHEEYKYKSKSKVLRIKRYIKYANGKSTWQRLDFNFYKDYLTNQTELDRTVNFLNGHSPDEFLKGLQFKMRNSFLPDHHVNYFIQKTRDEFANDDKKDIENRLRTWKLWGIDWFLRREKNPLKWKLYEKQWGIALLNMQFIKDTKDRIFPPQELRSKNTLIRVVWMMNNFFQYLYLADPNRYPPVAFSPISKKQYSDLLAERKKRKLVRTRGHINEKDWDIIKEHIRKDPDLAPIELCYEFGLRRNEALAIHKDSFYKETIYVERQVRGDFRERWDVKNPKYNSIRHIPLKVSELEPEDYQRIIFSNRRSSMTPFQINAKWRKLMKSLRFDYDIHDCRHSFCRRMIRIYDPKQLMEFAGHKSILTTNGYLQSHTEYSQEKLFKDISNW